MTRGRAAQRLPSFLLGCGSAALSLDVHPPTREGGSWQAPAPIAVDPRTSSDVTVTLRFEPWGRARLFVRAVDAHSGAPADIADVKVKPLAPARRSWSRHVEHAVDGARVSRLHQGRWQVRVVAQGNRRGTCEVDLIDDAETSLDCRVGTPGAIVGTLVFGDDVPPDQRRIDAVWTEPHDAGRHEPQAGQRQVQGTRGFVPVSALAGGTFRLVDIDPDAEVTLLVNDGFVWGRTRVRVPAATEVTSELRLHHGGAVRVAGPGVRDGVTVRFTPIAHEALAVALYARGEGTQVALAPGRWSYRADAPGEASPRGAGEVEVVRGQVTDLTIGGK